MERHYFSAANTPLGFFSCFDQVTDRYNANRVYYIKGGSGCGKSTFMRKAGGAFSDCEYFHCSSDVHSLDGVYIPSKAAAIFDATAPHVQDPILCGAADEIIDFGAFLNKDILIEHRAEIRRLAEEKGSCFANAYRYLAAAQELSPIPVRRRDTVFEKTLAALKERYCLNTWTEMPGRQRRLFADGFTPQGMINFYDRLFDERIIRITGSNAGYFLEELGTAFRLCGYDTDLLLDPMHPDCCLHLLIKDLSLAFSSTASDGITEEIILSPAPSALDTKLCGRLIERALHSLKQAKELHGQIEEYYIPAVDFSKVDQKLTEVLIEIKGY